MQIASAQMKSDSSGKQCRNFVGGVDAWRKTLMPKGLSTGSLTEAGSLRPPIAGLPVRARAAAKQRRA